MSTARTLSLADVARLAGVERPVATMWRKRPKNGLEFPSELPDGRYDGQQIVEWLQATGRGNNRDVHTELALYSALSPTTPVETLRDLRTMLAARTLLDEPLSGVDVDELVDAIEGLDPDDAWLLTEFEGANIELLRSEVDAIADAAWSSVAAYDRVVAALAQRDRTPTLAPELLDLAASFVKAVVDDPGLVVDVAGSATDIVLAVTADEDFPTPDVTLVRADVALRGARQRYAVHHLDPLVLAGDDSWIAPVGESVIVATLPHDHTSAFDLLEEISLQLASGACALVFGPAALLVDELASEVVGRRDSLLRRHVVRAVARLPRGQAKPAVNEHQAIWLMQSGAKTVRVGDLSGERFTRARREALLDDLVATARSVKGRAFAELRTSSAAEVVAQGTSLLASRSAHKVEVPPPVGDDAARIQQLQEALANPLTGPLAGFTPRIANREAAPTLASLGDLVRTRRVRMIPGLRLAHGLPTGTTTLWTAKGVAAQRPESVDLLALTTAHPTFRWAQADDVVFTTAGTPRAVVNTEPNAVVAYPARILRPSPSSPVSPRALAATINTLEPGNSQWRSWQVPVVTGYRGDAEEALKRLDNWEFQLRTRQTQLEELRNLVIRSVLPGAVTLNPIPPPAEGTRTTQKGQ